MLDSLSRLEGVPPCQQLQLYNNLFWNTAFSKLTWNGIMFGTRSTYKGKHEIATLLVTRWLWCQLRRTHSECHRSWVGPAASCHVCLGQRGLTWPGSPDGTGSPTVSVPFSLLCGSLCWYGAYRLQTLGTELASLDCSHLPTRCPLGNHLDEPREGRVIQACLHSYMTIKCTCIGSQVDKYYNATEPLRYFM